MTHTALTAMGRGFGGHRGRAVSLAALGHQTNEALLPLAMVWLHALVGWRMSWLVSAAVIVLAALPAIYRLMRVERTPLVDDLPERRRSRATGHAARCLVTRSTGSCWWAPWPPGIHRYRHLLSSGLPARSARLASRRLRLGSPCHGRHDGRIVTHDQLADRLAGVRSGSVARDGRSLPAGRARDGLRVPATRPAPDTRIFSPVSARSALAA